MTQLELLGDTATVETTLTARQHLALAFIRQNGPVTSDEVGALLHQERLARGRRGHHRDERCDWCTREGRQMGDSLRSKGIVRYRRLGGWYVPGHDHTLPQPSSQLGPDDPFPEGF